MFSLDSADQAFLLTETAGALVLLLSANLLNRQIKLHRHGDTAEGVVVDVEYSGTSSPRYYAVVRFWTPQCEWVTARAAYGTDVPGCQAGDTVRVRFDPANPSHFTVGTDGSTLRPWASAIGGAAICLYGLIKYLNL
ncbi:DUF3592 domain-containing protein [Hymenobacter oligotrophus]|uniref:DUF3592 domain-containing protein n=1 Tax=Hymenobacter oligotrophus TaxID=2319843 RepID=A0A3B7QSS8_9BACT|nr:DUF3592 domain-containing protein [Hymenobacter oligotrophus]AYA36068.1 DUF3592 domain-containing protein [Hymenobacter oligotrophus]